MNDRLELHGSLGDTISLLSYTLMKYSSTYNQNNIFIFIRSQSLQQIHRLQTPFIIKCTVPDTKPHIIIGPRKTTDKPTNKGKYLDHSYQITIIIVIYPRIRWINTSEGDINRFRITTTAHLSKAVKYSFMWSRNFGKISFRKWRFQTFGKLQFHLTLHHQCKAHVSL